MKTQFYLEKLEKSKEYKEFIKKNKSAYLCSCFFMIDKENNSQEIHFDFYIDSEKKMFSFKLNEKIDLVPLEIFDKRIPEKLVLDKNFDLDVFEKLILDKMNKENIKESAKKFLYSFQVFEKKKILSVTVFLSNLALLKISFDFGTKKIIDFERKSFFDIIKVVKK